MRIHELPRWAKVVGVWIVVGALLVGEIALVQPRNPHGPFRPSVAGEVLRAVLWLFATLALIQANRAWPLVGEGRRVRVAVHALLSVLAMGLIYLARVFMAIGLSRHFELADFVFVFSTSFHPHLILDVPIYWIVLGFVHHQHMQEVSQAAAIEEERKRQTLTFASSAAIREAAHREERLRAQLTHAELAALKQQLHPHFLFNALNTVSSLVLEEQRERAVEALAQLSGLLRRLMTNAGRQEITLAEEMDYISAYLAIEQMRFEERLIATVDVPEHCLRAVVPAFLLQPIVENAIKHGIARRRSPGRVHVTAARAGDRLRLRVTNDPAETSIGQTPAQGHGLGLETTRSRLQLAYDGDFTLQRVIDGPDGTVVSIDLPWRQAPDSTPTGEPTHG